MHYETYHIRAENTKFWLTRRFYEEKGRPPGAQALQDALGVLEARARFEGEEHPVHIRVAEYGGAIYVDLANEVWEVVEITARGWQVISDPPVRFRRTKGMKSLPRPTKGGHVEDLRKIINLESDRDWCLLVGWLLQAFNPAGPYPSLILQGEQGSAKSTVERVLRSIVDPSTTPLKTTPRSERDLVIAANNSWVVAFDNLSGLPPWLSDALCRLSTGGGFSTRALYTDSEEIIFEAMRPVLLNGITSVATRADLLDRSMILNLPAIPEDRRKPEAELWEEFDNILPRILGALFDALSAALRNLPHTQLDTKPRMADFALWATAAEEGLGWEPGTFMKAYDQSRAELNEMALESDPVAEAVREFMADREEWIDPPTKLLDKLNEVTDENTQRTEAWPKAPQSLTPCLKRQAPVLRKAGIEIETGHRSGKGRKIHIFKISPPVDRHDRHSRHTEEDSAQEWEKADDDGDGEVTAGSDPTPKDRHHENPIDKGSSGSGDGNDSDDSKLRQLSTGAAYTFITDRPGLDGVVEALESTNSPVGLDLETTGLNPKKDRVRLISITAGEECWLVDCFEVDPQPIFPILTEKRLIFHNGLFDLGFLTEMGFEPGEDGEVLDTMLMSQVLEDKDLRENKEAA